MGRRGPRQVSPFLGREDLLEVVQGAAVRASSGHLALVVVGGPAGIGKSRAVEEAVARTGLPVSRTVGLELEAGSPAVDLVTELCLQAGVDRPAAPGSEETLLAAASAVAAHARAAGPAAVIVEDLHGCTGVDVLPVLCRVTADAPLLLVVTHRTGHATARPLRAALVALERVPEACRLALGPLAHAEQRKLAAHRCAGRVDEARIDEVLRRADGNTLFLEELSDAAAAGDADGVPDRLQERVAVMLDGLSPRARELAALLAVLGPVTAHHEALAVAGDDDVDRSLDELLDRGMLRPLHDGYAFRHELVREAVVAGLRPATRRRLHLRCADSLAEHAAGRPDPRLVTHWRGAGRPGEELAAALSVATSAAERGEAEEALRWTLHALDVVRAGVSADVTERDLLVLAADRAGRAGNDARAATLLTDAVARTDDTAEAAALRTRLVAALFLAGDLAGAARIGQGLVAALDGPDGARLPASVRALAGAASAFVRAAPGTAGSPLTAGAEALRDAEASGDPRALSVALVAHALALAAGGDVGAAEAGLRRAEEVAADLPDPRDRLRPVSYRLVVLLGLGATDVLVAAAREAVVTAERLGAARVVGRPLRAILAEGLLEAGRWAEALDVVDDGLAWGHAGLSGATLLLVRAEVLAVHGAAEDAARDLAVAAESLPGAHPRWSLAAAEAAWWRGDTAVSRFHAARGLTSAGVVGRMAETARLALALARTRPDGPDGALLRTVLDRLGSGPVPDHVAALDAAARAELADEDAAVPAWVEAVAVARRAGTTPLVATALWGLGRAERRAGQDRSADRRFTEAHRLAEELGAAVLLGRLRAVTAPAVPVGAPLTAREEEILELVAEGWTDRRIAAELGISPRTVGVHVSRVLAKLGVERRGEAAALARRLGRAHGPAATG